MISIPEQRYEISTTIGPCTEAEAVALVDAILDLPEAKAVWAGGVSLETYIEPLEESAQ